MRRAQIEPTKWRNWTGTTVLFALSWLTGLTPASAVAQATISGAITNSLTWSNQVVLSGDVVIRTNGTLTIQPGTVIKAAKQADDQAGGVTADRVELIVEGGRLVVVGTTNAPVLFTSAATNGAPGDWHGLRFLFGSMTLKHTIIEYGRRGLSIVGGGELAVSDSVFRKSSEDGVLFATAGLYDLANCEFLNNGQHGVNATEGGSRVTLTNCQVRGNGSNGLLLRNNSTLMDCVVTQNGGDGLECGSGLTLTRVMVKGNSGDGVRVSGAVRVIDSTISNNSGHGYVNNNYDPNLVVQGSVIEGNKNYGVLSGYGGGSARFENCVIRFNGGSGIDWYEHLAVIGCTVVNNGQQGISGADNINIQNSTISNNKGGVDVARRGSLTGSALVGNAEFGLRLRGNDNPVLESGITNNLFRANGSGIKLESSAGRIVFSGNDFIENGLAVENRGTAAAIANGNYWGEPMKVELQNRVLNLSRIYDSRDDRSVGHVLIADFLIRSFSDPLSQKGLYSRPPFLTATKTVTGTISGAQVWTGTVFLTGDVRIPADASLTVLPGAKVISDWVADDQAGGADASRAELIVEGGRLVIVGTTNAPVSFASAATNAMAGDWFGLHFRSGSLTLKHANIEYGWRGLSIEGGGEVAVSDSVFQKSSASGIRIAAASFIEISNCAFLNNAYGVSAIAQGSRVTLRNCQVSSNRSDGLSLQDNSLLVDCVVIQNGGGGLECGSGLTLTRVMVKGNSGDGVRASGAVRITGCSIANNGGNGYENQGSSPTLVMQDTLVEHNKGNGFLSRSDSGSARFERSTIQFNDQAGAFWAVTLSITGCTVANNGGEGVVGYNVSIENSTISNNKGGVDVARVSLTGSALVGNGEYGLRLWGDNPVLEGGITNNLFRANGVGIRLESRAARLEFSSNDFVENGLAVENRGTTAAIANGNYWGEATTSELQRNISNLSKIYDQRDDPSVGPVTITNYSTVPLNASPSITIQPQPSEVMVGTVAAFPVVAAGKEPLTYQWQLNGIDLADDGRIQGARTNKLVITNVSETDAGVLIVTVRNNFGRAVSDPAIITVNSAPLILPQITQQPAPVAVAAGGNAAFAVSASGTQPLSYQWRKNGNLIAGATATVLSLTNTQAPDAGEYSVLVSNRAGSVASQPAALTVNLLRVATPSFDPVSGVPVPVSVKITTQTPEALIYWSSDGSDPNTNSTRYVGPVNLSARTTLKARAFKDGFLPSDVATASFPEALPPARHAADFREPFYVIDGTEVNRVLSYWRAGGYHSEASGLDGYASNAGSTNGVRHTADYRDPPWIIDGTEANRVLSYWRAGGYHSDAGGLDGYAAGRNVTTLGRKASTRFLEAHVTARHAATATYMPGALLDVKVKLTYTKPPLGLLLRAELPSDWRLVFVTGDGNPELNRGEILWTGAIPASPINIAYTVAIPSDEAGVKHVMNRIECHFDEQSNPIESRAESGKLTLGAQGTGFAQLTRIDHLKDGRVLLQLRAEKDARYQIQRSRDFTHWSVLGFAFGGDDMVEIFDSVGGAEEIGFYRVVFMP